MSKKLTEIRKKIDTLDHKIHDLLMQRADLIMGVAAEKKKNNIQIVHPEREAQMVRRLLKRHTGPLPESAILSIWRELVGAVCMMQTGLNVAVPGTENFHAHWDMAKNYFGSVLPMSKVATSLMAVASVRDNDTSFAVLPWPDEGLTPSEETPWWVHLYNNRGDNKIRIVCALPYGAESDNFLSMNSKAMIISKIEFLESGEDHSCIVIETDSSISRAKIVEELEKLKLKPLGAFTKSGLENDSRSLHMVIIDGYLYEDNEKLKDIENMFEDVETKCVALGGYPVPPNLKPIKRTTE